MTDSLDRRGVIDIGSRLELLLDDDLIAGTNRDAALLLHRPVPQEVVLETGAPDELSIYVSEGYWRGQGVSLRRYRLRVDDFVSLNAPLSGGEMVTRPLRFQGSNLELNFSASAGGSVRVEILHGQVDRAIESFGLADCVELLGDDLERTVRWIQGADVSRLSGEAVRLRFVLHDADLYAFQFVE